jgi:hypothetical protein
MQFHLYKVSGYEEAIMSLRMSHGKFYSWGKAQQIQDLVYAVTNKQGFLATQEEYEANLIHLGIYLKSGTHLKYNHPKVKGFYNEDIQEFKRLLGLTKNNAMGQFDHHTLMKYIDISFFTDGLHRGGQDDLDAHAMGFNNRITRFSTRLAEIGEPVLSEWYRDKVIPFDEAMKLTGRKVGNHIPESIMLLDGTVFKYSPFGYILEKYADMAKNNGLYKDVQRGLIPLGQEGCALWKSDLFNMRYIYLRRSKLTKANPELKLGMEMLADQIEKDVPVFGENFRQQFTDTGKWEHMNRVRTVTNDEFRGFEEWKKSQQNT